MNLAITEPWLDLFGASIAILGFVVAIFVGIREWMDMQQRIEVAPLSPAFAQAGAVWERPRYQPTRTRLARSVAKTQFALPRNLTETTVSSQLVFNRVLKSGNSQAHLSMCNEGNPLKLEDVVPGMFNELDITPDTNRGQLKQTVNSFGLLQFQLDGQDLENSTYQFTLLYRDTTGRRYRQEIAGLGTEPPIVDQPVLVGT